MIRNLLSKIHILRDALSGLESIQMSLEPKDSKTLSDVLTALLRIAEALERQSQAYPPINTKKLTPDTTTERKREDTKASKDESVTKVTDDTTSNMEYRGSQLFFKEDCGPDCPKQKSCIEYQYGEECIGWKTPRYKGGKSYREA